MGKSSAGLCVDPVKPTCSDCFVVSPGIYLSATFDVSPLISSLPCTSDN